MVDAQATEMVHKTMPYTATLGIEVLRSEPAETRSRLAWAANLCTAAGALHGGALMSVADANGGLCAFLNLPEGSSGTTTIESKTNFLRAVRDGHVTAVSRPLHVGRRIVVVETDLLDDAGTLVGRVTQTQAVL
ncbi:PaaI family thioesterase [Labedaea rhizosphaerae]|uniref:PaaI family thioesterase n=1 Tax=Labedaea rhizosphaerae TaxID=598644 RepID=UPI0014151920|nr:PaaI family thioesterase [Labedaea rhizosphaerae]